MITAKTKHLAASIFLAVLGLGACHRDAPAVKLGTYRVVLQVPGGEIGALRLTLVSIAISVAALFASEAIAQRASRRVAGL